MALAENKNGVRQNSRFRSWITSNWGEISRKYGVDITVKFAATITFSLIGTVAVFFWSGGAKEKEGSLSQNPNGDCSVVVNGTHGSVTNNISCNVEQSQEQQTDVINRIERLEKKTGIASQKSAALGPGVKGVRVGMTLTAVKSKINIFQQADHTDGKLGIPPLKGYYDSTEIVVIGGFRYGISLHFSEASDVLDFISLHQWFGKADKIPDFADVEAALNAKYGRPLRIWEPEPHDQNKYKVVWIPDSGMIELNNNLSRDSSEWSRPSSVIYFTLSDHGSSTSPNKPEKYGHMFE
jgi:hypothetical protein